MLITRIIGIRIISDVALDLCVGQASTDSNKTSNNTVLSTVSNTEHAEVLQEIPSSQNERINPLTNQLIQQSIGE